MWYQSQVQIEQTDITNSFYFGGSSSRVETNGFYD
jgi:hypothetical protein